MKDKLRKNYKPQNDICGYPQKYKTLDLHPLMLRDFDMQDIFYKVFAYPKNYVPNIEVIKMSYMKYIFFIVQSNVNKDGHEMMDWTIEILKYITKKDVGLEVQTSDDIKTFDDLNIRIKIGEEYFTENDFENIREVVLEQNGLSIEYVEAYNVELEQKLAFVNRSELDLSDEVSIFCSMSNFSMVEIMDKYTLYQFKEHFERKCILENFNMYKPLEVSGQIKLKNGEIDHYFYHSKRKGRYDSILISKDEFVSKNDELFNDSKK